MGIDARILLRVRGNKPTDEQLTLWSWDIANAIGAEKFFINDGLPPDEYHKASEAWHAAFNAHPSYQDLQACRAGNDFLKLQAVRETILAAIGAAPRELRRAIDLCHDHRYIEENEEYAEIKAIPQAARAPGRIYCQDGDPIVSAEGEWLLRVSLWSRWYDKGYERGDLLTICAVAEWCEVNVPNCEVWYGGDSSGVLAKPFPDTVRRDLRRYLYSADGRDYFNRGWTSFNETRVLPPKCALCTPEERRTCAGGGSGGATVFIDCGGCGKRFRTDDAGKTWCVPPKDQ